MMTFLAVLSMLVAMPQCSYDGPPAAGTLRNVDTQAGQLMAEGQAYEASGKLRKARKKYERVVERHELSLEAPDALMRIGAIWLATKDPIEAFDAYQKLINKYPGSTYYEQALNKQLDLALGATQGRIKNEVFGFFSSNIDPSKVYDWVKKIADNAPYADITPRALNMLGHYLVARNQGIEAIDAFQKIVDNHPNTVFAPEAQLIIAELYSGKSPCKGRDWFNMNKAQEAYENYLLKFSKSTDKATQGLAFVRKDLVERKLKIADYYLERMKDTSAATFYYQEVVAAAKENPAAAAQAQARLKDLGVKEK